MTQNLKKIVFILLFIISYSSCVSKKDVIYFQNDSINQNEVSNTYTTVFKTDDLLQITVSALDLESVKPFNLPLVSFSSDNTIVGNPQLQTFLIDSNGEIDFPILGKMKIAGMSREEFIKHLTDKLSDGYVNNPTINVRIANYKITVLGDVFKPGSYTIPNERITIFEAIALSGDLNISGVRNDIQVHREENGKKNIYNIDLLSKSVFTSPVYYLQQNDLIYVKQNYAKSQYAVFNPNTGLFVSIASIFIALISIIK